MNATMNTRVLIADPIVLNNSLGVYKSPRDAKEIVQAMGGIFVDGPIPEGAVYPPGKTVFSYQPNLSPEQITEATCEGQFDGIIVAAKAVKPKEGRAQVNGKPFLKFAVRIGAGVNNVEEVEKAGGVIMNMPGFNSEPTSQAIIYALNSLLSPDKLEAKEKFEPTDLMRQTQDVLDRQNKRADSDDLSAYYHGGWPEFKGTPSARKRICFVGASGHIGGLTAEALAAAGHDVVGVSRNPQKAAAERPSIKEWTDNILEAAKNADVIIVQIPENDTTRELISEAVMCAAKKGVIIVNAARAGVVDTEALQRLAGEKEQHIGGLITDIDHFTTPGKPSPSEPYIKTAEILRAQGKRAIIAPHTFADTHSPSRELGGMQAIRQALRAIAIMFGITKEPYINRATTIGAKFQSTKEDGLKLNTLHPTIVAGAEKNLAITREKAEAARSKVFAGGMPG